MRVVFFFILARYQIEFVYSKFPGMSKHVVLFILYTSMSLLLRVRWLYNEISSTLLLFWKSVTRIFLFQYLYRYELTLWPGNFIVIDQKFSQGLGLATTPKLSNPPYLPPPPPPHTHTHTHIYADNGVALIRIIILWDEEFLLNCEIIR